MTNIKNNIISQENPENNNTVSENVLEERPLYSAVSVKGTIAEEKVQKAIRECVSIPKAVIVKEVRKSYKPEGTDTATQKIKVMSGTTIENAASHELTLVGIELDPVEAVNKKYRIVDYTLGLEANMSAGRFNGYSATGLKLMVTKLEEIK